MKMDPTTYLLIIYFACLLVHGSCQEDCNVFPVTIESGLFADCSHQQLTSVPQNIPNSMNITKLDLSLNNITTIGYMGFQSFPNLVWLNLSMSLIQELHDEVFVGLKYLQILDLTNNPVLTNIHQQEDLFRAITTLKTLHVSGQPIPAQMLLPLVNLQQLTMSASPWSMPYELNQLHKLTVLTFAFLNKVNLTKQFLEPFTKLSIKELAFHSWDIEYIENGTFDNFTDLKLLNLFGNIHLSVDNVIDAISTSKGVNITGLILDLVGSKRKSALFLGPVDEPVCRSAWLNLKHISVRGVSLIGMSDHFAPCLSNLESLACGFNTPYLGNVSMFVQFRSLKYLDISNLMASDFDSLREFEGYYKRHGWIPPNKSFFPGPQFTTYNSTLTSGEKMHHNSWNQCSTIPLLPECATYIKADHMAAPAHLNNNNHDNIKCAYVPTNNIRYINASYRFYNQINGLSTFDIPVYGLNKLEIVDLTEFGLLNYNMSNLQFFPSLTEFYIGKNPFGQTDLGDIPNDLRLRVIDLSHNAIGRLSDSMFVNLLHLEILQLNGNLLQTVNFLAPNLHTLQHLDVQDNRLGSLNASTSQMLDRLFSSKSSFWLDITDNPFQCNCQQLKFIKWLQITSVNIRQKEFLKCASSDNRLIDIDADLLHSQCTKTALKIGLSAVSVGISITILITSLLLYKYRWSIKWRFYKLRYLSQKEQTDILLRNVDGDHLFSAFIIFPMEDDPIRAWVFGGLRTRVEYVWQRRPLFLRGRDDTPGYAEVDNIVNGLLDSQVALWVVCPGFFEDRLCEMAAHFALNQLGHKNNILLIMEDRFQEYVVPKHFINILNPKMGIERLHFTTNQDGQNLFWSKLEAFIPI